MVTVKGELEILMSPQKGSFYSSLTECGPTAVLTSTGIVLLYNFGCADSKVFVAVYDPKSKTEGDPLP